MEYCSLKQEYLNLWAVRCSWSDSLELYKCKTDPDTLAETDVNYIKITVPDGNSAYNGE